MKLVLVVLRFLYLLVILHYFPFMNATVIGILVDVWIRPGMIRPELNSLSFSLAVLFHSFDPTFDEETFVINHDWIDLYLPVDIFI